MHELERKIEENEKLHSELEKKESHEKEFEIQQRDVLAVRLKMQELQRTIGQQEETIQGYSELLKQIGFTTTQTGTAGFRVNF
jgi:RNA binding exosome subunit